MKHANEHMMLIVNCFVWFCCVYLNQIADKTQAASLNWKWGAGMGQRKSSTTHRWHKMSDMSNDDLINDKED